MKGGSNTCKNVEQFPVLIGMTGQTGKYESDRSMLLLATSWTSASAQRSLHRRCISIYGRVITQSIDQRHFGGERSLHQRSCLIVQVESKIC